MLAAKLKIISAAFLLAALINECNFQLVSAGSSEKSGSGVLKFFSGSSNKRLYDAVDKYLTKNGSNGDQPEQDIEKAISWLELKVKGKSWFDPRPLGTALKQLTGLRALKGDLRCDNKKSLSLIRANIKATRKQEHKGKSGASNSTPIEKIVHYYLAQHAKGCLPAYRERFEVLQKELNWQKVKDFAVGDMNSKVLIATKKSKALKWGFTDFESLKENLNRVRDGYEVTKFVKTKRIPEPNSLLEVLRYLSSDNPNSKFLYNHTTSNNGQVRDGVEIKDGFEQILSSTILEPCKQFLKTVGFKVLAPLNYEYKFLEDSMSSKSQFIHYLDLNVGLLATRLCRNILINERKLYKSVKPLLLGDGQKLSRAPKSFV